MFPRTEEQDEKELKETLLSEIQQLKDVITQEEVQVVERLHRRM